VHFEDFNGKVNFEAFAQLQRCCQAPGRVSSLGDFIAQHKTFLVYNLGLTPLANLMDRGASVSIQATRGGNGLFLVTFPEKSAGDTGTDQ